MQRNSKEKLAGRLSALEKWKTGTVEVWYGGKVANYKRVYGATRFVVSRVLPDRSADDRASINDDCAIATHCTHFRSGAAMNTIVNVSRTRCKRRGHTMHNVYHGSQPSGVCWNFYAIKHLANRRHPLVWLYLVVIADYLPCNCRLFASSCLIEHRALNLREH